jgi:iron complex transport system substrate-binding protein
MKVLSLSPSATDIVLAIGGGDRLAGVTAHCPDQAPGARLGSPKTPDLGLIEGLAPDVILADAYDNRPEDLRRLQSRFRVVTLDVRSPSQAADAAAEIGRVMGMIEPSRKLVSEILEAQKQVKDEAADSAALPVLVLLWNQPFLTVNFDTYISRLIEAAGGKNVFREDPVRELPIEIEDMVEKDPGLLLLAGDPFPFKKRHIQRFRDYRVFSKIPIEVIDGKLLSRYGPVTVKALKKVSALLASARAARASA